MFHVFLFVIFTGVQLSFQSTTFFSIFKHLTLLFIIFRKDVISSFEFIHLKIKQRSKKEKLFVISLVADVKSHSYG